MPEIVIGILFALFVYECSGYSPGGVITAGYFALFAFHGEFILGTLIAAVITWGAVKALSRYIVLYGRRLFSIYLLVGLLISQGLPTLLDALKANALGVNTFDVNIFVVGYILPGLIASDAGKQGWLPTMGALLLTVGLTRVAITAGGGLLW